MSRRHTSRRSKRVRAVLGPTLAGALTLTGLAAVSQAAEDPARSGPATDPPHPTAAAAQTLDRGLVSVHRDSGNLVSWRWLASDPDDVAFHVYQGDTRVTEAPITTSTNFLHRGGAADAEYTVRAVVDGQEQPPSASALSFASGYLDVPLDTPSGDYHANDASVGDLNGDSTLEFVLKWDPANSRDNSQAGTTDPTLIDAYTLAGDRLWRIDLGRNIRSGAHYTQFQVYDYDGDGRAEVAMKTADGTVDGQGTVIGDGAADHRNAEGYVLTNPEFLTVFDGRTGAALDTVDYVPARGDVCSRGDCYGNRVVRFLAATAHLDGERPSLVMARGYRIYSQCTGLRPGGEAKRRHGAGTASRTRHAVGRSPSRPTAFGPRPRTPAAPAGTRPGHRPCRPRRAYEGGADVRGRTCSGPDAGRRSRQARTGGTRPGHGSPDSAQRTRLAGHGLTGAASRGNHHRRGPDGTA